MTPTTSTQDFLFELGCEELPPKALSSLSSALAEGIKSGLSTAGIAHGAVRRFATPRRLAVFIEAVAAHQEQQKIERRGPPVTQAFDKSGTPTQAAIAFARSCGTELASLDRIKTDKGEWLVYRAQTDGASTSQLVPGIIQAALDALPIPKRMRWGSGVTEFVRPVHWTVLLLGDRVVDATLLGLPTGRTTWGHRFHCPEPIELALPADYAPALLRAKVVADFGERRDKIRQSALEMGTSLGTTGGAQTRVVMNEALLDEVTALTEWPVPIAGMFDARFLDLPREVVVSTVEHHQRYFPVVTASDALTRHFITISNIESRDPAQVRAGNERVVRPRLSDAAFFWEQDCKVGLSEFAERLATVTYQTKLGSYADKTRRIVALAQALAAQLPGAAGAGASTSADTGEVTRAAELAKADLLTAMVGEFPELQGTMGRYYALVQNESAAVALAIEEQYLPRYSGDRLPNSAAGRALAVADRLDTLAGIFAIGQRPSGAKDPFGLRRAALGILRIAFDARLEFDLIALIERAVALQPVAKPAAAREVYDFLMDRLRGEYSSGQIATSGTAAAGIAASGEMFDAVLAAAPGTLLDFDARLKALQEFWRSPDAVHLAAANKRIVNILKKIPQAESASVEAALLVEPAEIRLHREIESLRPDVSTAVAAGNYTAGLQRLTSLRPAVDAVFDTVMIMDEDPARRTNRVALLSGLRRLFSSVADLARLSV